MGKSVKTRTTRNGTVNGYREKHGENSLTGFFTVGRIAGTPAIPIDLHNMIVDVVVDLNKVYIPYTMSWVMQRKKDVWGQILEVEDRITVSVLCNDEKELGKWLREYYDIWMRMCVEFEVGGRKYVPF
jgi:hypothetical protein